LAWKETEMVNVGLSFVIGTASILFVAVRWEVVHDLAKLLDEWMRFKVKVGCS
jgi:hypothetical protein